MKSSMTLSVVSRALGAGLLLMALARLPYGYFVFLRWAVCAASVYHVFLAYSLRRWVVVAVSCAVAILFNPFVPIYLHRSTWAPIDVTLAALFLLSFAFFRAPKTGEEPTTKQ